MFIFYTILLFVVLFIFWGAIRRIKTIISAEADIIDADLAAKRLVRVKSIAKQAKATDVSTAELEFFNALLTK